MAAAVHPTAQAGWSGEGADEYERGRPGYPRAAIELIGHELGVGRDGPNRILDLAAGTGKLTRELTILGAEVTAVEPVAGMRERFTAAVPAPAGHGRDWPGELDATGRFEPFQQRTVPNPQRTDLAGLRARWASMSFVASLPAERRAAVLDTAETRLRELGLREGQEIELPTSTTVRWARRRADVQGSSR